MSKSFLLLSLINTLYTQVLFAKDRNILAYTTRGVKYYPKYVNKGHVKVGKASWYGKPFHGRLTANGERYNMYAMTAAHRTYAMGTRLRVTNLKNHRSVIVKINDRGPFYSSRDIDLSYGAAKSLNMVKSGVCPVKIEVISSGKKRTYKKKGYKKRSYAKNSKRISKIKSVKKLPTYHKQLAAFSDQENAYHFKRNHHLKNLKIVKYYSKTQQRTLYRVVAITRRKAIPKVATKKLQLASFSNRTNAYRFKKQHKLDGVRIVSHYSTAQKKTIYRVVLNCTLCKAQKILKSKKFSGAYFVS